MSGRGWLGVALGGALWAGAGCGDGRAGLVPADHQVTLAWEPSHEKGVNGPGGGYRVVIGGRSAVDLPYPGPATLTTTLHTGRYGVAVQAYQPDPEGAGTAWSPAASLTVVVP